MNTRTVGLIRCSALEARRGTQTPGRRLFTLEGVVRSRKTPDRRKGGPSLWLGPLKPHHRFAAIVCGGVPVLF